MNIILSHPFGNPNVYNAALAFEEESALSEFHTCLFAPLGTSYRASAGLRGTRIRVHPFREVTRLGMCRFGIGSLNGRGQPWVDWVTRGFDGAVARTFDRGVEAVYCYEDSALATFHEAGKSGVRKFYELASGYQDEARAVAECEVEREPELARWCTSLHEPTAKVARKAGEVSSADRIICASTYCGNTLRKHVDVKGSVIVLPYGCDCDRAPRQWCAHDFKGPLKLVLVGRLAPLKGLPYLFEALEKLPPGSFELTLVGRWLPGFREWLLRRYRVQFTEVGQVAQPRVLELMRQSHLLVLPSLFEGFGLVLLEAMSVGVPVLATERTGAPDIIENMKEGFIVRAASSENIVTILSKVLENREQLAEMGASAFKRAASLSWAEYRRRLFSLVANDLHGAGSKLNACIANEFNPRIV